MIGDLGRRIAAKKAPAAAQPDGGIGGLTPAEEAELDDLVNGPHKPCRCGRPCCGQMPTDPAKSAG